MKVKNKAQPEMQNPFKAVFNLLPKSPDNRFSDQTRAVLASLDPQRRLALCLLLESSELSPCEKSLAMRTADAEFLCDWLLAGIWTRNDHSARKIFCGLLPEFERRRREERAKAFHGLAERGAPSDRNSFFRRSVIFSPRILFARLFLHAGMPLPSIPLMTGVGIGASIGGHLGAVYGLLAAVCVMTGALLGDLLLPSSETVKNIVRVAYGRSWRERLSAASRMEAWEAAGSPGAGKGPMEMAVSMGDSKTVYGNAVIHERLLAAEESVSIGALISRCEEMSLKKSSFAKDGNVTKASTQTPSV